MRPFDAVHETAEDACRLSAQDKLDTAVRAAYGMKAKDDPLAFLLALNAELADREASLRPIVGPGLPPTVKDPAAFVTGDCMSVG